jgi:hypothetical protein
VLAGGHFISDSFSSVDSDSDSDDGKKHQVFAKGSYSLYFDLVFELECDCDCDCDDTVELDSEFELELCSDAVVVADDSVDTDA